VADLVIGLIGQNIEVMPSVFKQDLHLSRRKNIIELDASYLHVQTHHFIKQCATQNIVANARNQSRIKAKSTQMSCNIKRGTAQHLLVWKDIGQNFTKNSDGA